MQSQTIAFDVYGTLVDPLEMSRHLQMMVGDKAEALSKLWREKQVEYAFRRGLMGRYEPFGVCTLQALNYAMEVLDVSLSTEQQGFLMAQYQQLQAYADVIPGIESLKAQGHYCVAFSNGPAVKVKELLDKGEIGEVRHINWHFNKAANDVDLSQQYNWRTDKNIALGGYFDDLASHGLDLFNYLLGDIENVVGLSTNQQNLYSAKDAIVASWIHQSGVTGSGSWNFGCSQRADKVEILGNKGRIEFSVFDEQPIKLVTIDNSEELLIDNPKNIQLYHAINIQKHLSNEGWHPSTGETATHTAWVMDNILK